MKRIKINFTYNGKNIEQQAVLNDDINKGAIVAYHPDNKFVDAQWGLAEELGVWALKFSTRRHYYECDFVAEVLPDGTEHLTFIPVEVLVWSRSGKSLNNDRIPFTIEFV